MHRALLLMSCMLQFPTHRAPVCRETKASQLQDWSMAPGEGPCLSSPRPVPSCHLPPLLLSLAPRRPPEGSRSLAAGGEQPDGRGSETESEPPHQRVSQSLCPGSHAGPANIPGLQAQLSRIPAWDFGKHWQQTPPHLRHSSDLLEPGQRGCPRPFLPGNRHHQPVPGRGRNTSLLRACLRLLKGLRHWLLALGSLWQWGKRQGHFSYLLLLSG